METKRRSLAGKDVMEIVIGSLLLAFPIAVTEEVWNLSKELTLPRTLLISASSIVVISIFVYTVYSHQRIIPRRREFYYRVVVTYVVTMLICAFLLAAIDRLDLLVDPAVAIKRTVLVAFPASFSASVLDSII